MKRELQIINKNKISFMKWPMYSTVDKPYRVSVLVTNAEMEYLKTIINDEALVNNFCCNIG